MTLKNEDTAVIHIEKARKKYKGIYPFLNREFLKNNFEDAVYVNREEDLGIPGLRKAKLFYHPHHFADKYLMLSE